MKKRALTADELLRLQEEPASKRLKIRDGKVLHIRHSSSEPSSDDSQDEAGRASDYSEEEGDSDVDFRIPHKADRATKDTWTDEDGSEEEEEDVGSSDDESSTTTPHFNIGSDPSTQDRFAPALKKKERDVSIPNSTPVAHSWTSLGVSTPLQAAMRSMSITTPTEVQAGCIPPMLTGRDCIGNAKTGSGKTIAFAIPILQKLLVDPYGIFALVLTPTRELAFQIAEQFAVLGGSVNVRTAVIVGGMDMMAQALELDNRPHVVIATPGRMVDHLKSTSGGWDLSRVKFLVLDEADRLLTPTFSPELSYLFNVLPKDRQTCLFTATLTPAIETLIDAPPRPGKSKPFVHRMKEGVETVSTLKQYYILVPSHVREVYLFRLLCYPPESTLHLRRAPPEPEKKGSKKPTKPLGKKGKKKSTEEEEIVQPPPTIIFCSRAQSVAYLTLLLKALGIRSTALHSRLTQRERLSSLSLFRASVVPVLVSTDVGARGLDIEDVAMVVNWDLPVEPEEYTHRVGRTARAGKGGVAISFVTEHDEERVVRIEGRINTKLEEMSLPEERVLEKLNAVSIAKRVARMDTDWDSVLQFVQEPLDLDFVPKQVSQKAPPHQIPTPPQSHDGSPVIDDGEESTVVSISTTFYPGAHLSPLQPDVILLSADGVFFYVHSPTLLAASDNGFGGRLPHSTPLDPASKDLDPFFSVPDQSSVLNVILHSAYDKSCAHYSPQFQTLVAAVNRLPTYGIPPKSRIQPSTPLYNVLLSYAPVFPLELYTLAATHDLYDLAVATSSHLLSFPLFQITDEMAERIGPVYLKKLFFLHFGRSDALKRVLLPPPQPHPPTPWCDFTEQKKLTRAWALASAYLAWDARPGPYPKFSIQ
ncbi:hypothetical protein EST38_g572 [Candolleomyces aberdarensis]|uniref:RNA helicase n=1 Tax=Candolleomyces aberdarensis TaxID=2316362 RepID=A0A4V1Q5D7_9AGAR|nr:hypothetical protein EST38_g572 [Candolleomyces aberdarensis]